MKKCTYCSKRATTLDAIGLDACIEHRNEADGYYRKRTGRSPNEDTFLYCDVHCDMWELGCERCEACCQHHYEMSVQEFHNSPLSKRTQVISFDNREDFFKFLDEGRKAKWGEREQVVAGNRSRN